MGRRLGVISKGQRQLSKFSALCMALPEAQRKVFGSHAEFRVRNKVFAYFLNNHHGDGLVSACFKSTLGENLDRASREPQRFYLPAYIGKQGWFAMRMDRGHVDWREAQSLLLRSFALAAPKTLSERAYREAEQRAPAKKSRTASAKPRVASGSFQVEMKPQREPLAAQGVSLGRLALNKRFEGDMVGVGVGEMLTAMTATQGSAGYVAIERFTGTVHGREGSFVFQHSGSMARGTQSLSIAVVPDSGSGELLGLAGRFTLRIEQGRHYYTFEYTLPTRGARGR
jgi:predicted DNA-binding protein (MmcQ/YjbR family)